MNLLRMVLLGLAVIVLGTIGWRLATAPRPPVTPPTIVASAPPAVQPAPEPSPAAPSAPLAAEPPPPATPPAAPQTETAPASPAPSPAPPIAASAPPAPAAAAPPAMTAQDAHAKIVAILEQAPELARAFDVLKAQFPTAGERSLAEATEALRTSGSAPSPDDLFAEAMRDLRQSAGVLAAKAGPEALGAIFEAKATVLADLEQADPRICADYLYGGTSPEFADFQAAHRALIAKTALTTIDAMVDGRTRQMTWAEPSPDDFHAIEVALAKRGLTAEEIADLLDGRSPDTPPSDARLCDNARTYLDVLKAMPPDARNRVYGLTAELLARS